MSTGKDLGRVAINQFSGRKARRRGEEEENREGGSDGRVGGLPGRGRPLTLMYVRRRGLRETELSITCNNLFELGGFLLGPDNGLGGIYLSFLLHDLFGPT